MKTRKSIAGNKDWVEWTTEQNKYLREHRHDGAEELSTVLPHSAGAITKQASRLGISLDPFRYQRGEICCRRGKREIDVTTVSGKRYGICYVCHKKTLTERESAKAEAEQADRDYGAAKTRYSNAKKRNKKSAEKS